MRGMARRVAVLSCAYPPYPGGVGVAAAGLAREAARHGYEVTVFTPAHRGRQPDQIADGVTVRFLPPLLRYGNAAILPHLSAELRRYDVAHLCYPFFGVAELLPFLRRRARTKVVVHHIMDAVAPGWRGAAFSIHRRLVAPWIFRNADLVLDMSEDYFAGSDLGRMYRRGRAMPPLDFLPLGVDTARFTPGDGPGRDVPVVIFVGGLDRAHYFKGIPVLLEAVARLRRSGLAFRCQIIGEGDLRPRYEAAARSAGLLESVGGPVSFLGLVPNDELPRYYRAGDVFVVPATARVESFSIATAEAQACGLPAVVTDFPGVRVTIADGVTGFVAKPGDAGDLAAKLVSLLQDPERRQTMGLAARARAVTNYDWAAVGAKLARCYERVLAS